MDNAIIEAWNKLYEYLYHDELKNYEECKECGDDELIKNHIWNSIELLNLYFNLKKEQQ